MARIRTALYLVLVISILSIGSVAQNIRPICDVSCGPDPTSPSYNEVIAARPKIINQRGGGHPLVRMPRLPILVKTVEASQSYDYSVNLLSLTGRNGLNVNLSLFYNSRIWTRSSSGISLNADLDNPSFGFRGLDFGFLQWNAAVSDYILTRADGTKSELFNVSGTSLYQSQDSTYIQFNATTNVWSLLARDGTQTFYAPFSDGSVLRPVKIENTNGNFITIAYANTTNLEVSTITDTLGRVITFSYDASGRITGISQGTKSITFTWNTTYVLNYNFSISVIGSAANGSTQSVLSSVKFANGTSVNFIYGDWGIVNRIERRSANGTLRAYVSYNYPTAAAGALSDAPGFTQQTIFDGVNTGVWNYAVSKNTAGLVTSFSVTDPGGRTTTATFSANGDWQDGLPLVEQTTDSSGKVWRKRTRTWTADNTTTGVNPHPASIVTQLDDGTQSQVTYAYDANGNITDVRESDFAAAAPGPLLRETVTSYASLGNHILNRPAQTLVKDGAGNIVARTDFAYDQYAAVPLKGLSPTPVQHDDVNYSTSPTVARGNLTTKTVYSNAAAGTGAITGTYTYDVAGNRVAAQEGCCTFTSTAYSSVTQYAFPDSVTVGPTGNQLTASFTYNFSTGTVASSTDANGQVTSFTYDVNDRVLSIHTPDGVTRNASYDDNSANPGSSWSSTADSEVVTTITDFAGHPLTKELLNGLSLVATVSSTRDVLGRLVQNSNPYGPSDAAAYTSYSYDALDREIQATPPALVSGVTQSSYQTAYSGHTTTYTDPAGKQRREYRNALGQLIQVDEPGAAGGAAGTGSVTVSGTEQSVSTPTGTGSSAGAASVNMSGTERSTQVLTHAATSGSASFTVNGVEQSATITVGGGGCKPPMPCCISAFGCGKETRAPWLRFLWTPPPPAMFFTTVYDQGTVTMTVNGFTVQVPYGSSSTGTTIATALAGGFNVASSPVTAVASGAGIALKAKVTGAATNYTVSYSSATTDTTGNFTTASFSISGPTALSGGTDNTYTTVYDTGTVTVSVTANGTTYSKSSNYGQTSTPSTIATDLANQINADTVMDKVVVASASTNILNLTTVATGTNTAYGLSTSALTNSSTFTTGSTSFTATPSGSTFTPGQNGLVYDTGTLTVTVTGAGANYQKSVNYSQGSTSTSVASALAGAITADAASPVNAAASGNVVTLTAKTTGADTNYGVTTQSATTQTTYFSSPSFNASAVSLSGGQEPTGTLSSPLSTFYSYNTLGELIQVTQGQQTRKFAYDSLGRLSSQNVPEKGNLADTFTYTDFGAIATRTDARGVKATYTYDSLNRLASITYSDGTPTVTYTYGAAGAANFAAGRLVQVTDGAGSESYQYDVMGRVVKCTRVIGTNTYTTSYTYTADGQMATTTYPSGRVVTNSYDAIGRLTQVGTGGSSLLDINSYNAAGQITALTYGNGTQANYAYNAQLQIASILYGPSTSPLLSLSYNWGGASDDGLLMGVTDASSSRSTSYAYDQLKRLTEAQTVDQTSANTWKLKFAYDRYGNRLSETPLGGTASMPSNQVTIDPTTNRITTAGISYDADGDMTADGAHTYTFDGEHRLIHVDGAANTYAYDGSGQRVNRNGNYYIYSAGRVIAEYAGGAAAASPSAEYVYARGKRVATIVSGAITYHHWDHASIRVSANAAGSVVRTFGHYPFGESWYETGTPDKWKFTTYERDAESGLDYALARFHSSRLGRFMSLDPWPAAQRNPQSWNRYAYTQNNPVSLSDPSGMCDEEDDSCDDSGDGGGGDPGALQDGGDDGSGGGGGGALDDGSGNGADDGSGNGADDGSGDQCGWAGCSGNSDNGGDQGGGDQGPGDQGNGGDEGSICGVGPCDSDNSNDPGGQDSNDPGGWGPGQGQGSGQNNGQNNNQNQPNQQQNQQKDDNSPGWCTALVHAGNTTVGLGGVVFIWGSLADAGVVTAPIGFISQASGAIGAAVGGIGIGIGDAGLALGICQ